MNRVIVRIPTGLQPFTAGATEVIVDADTLGGALSEVEARHPGLSARILNVFVADTVARFIDGLNTPVTDGLIISIIPAVAGG